MFFVCKHAQTYSQAIMTLKSSLLRGVVRWSRPQPHLTMHTHPQAYSQAEWGNRVLIPSTAKSSVCTHTHRHSVQPARVTMCWSLYSPSACHTPPKQTVKGAAASMTRQQHLVGGQRTVCCGELHSLHTPAEWPPTCPHWPGPP